MKNPGALFVTVRSSITQYLQQYFKAADLICLNICEYGNMSNVALGQTSCILIQGITIAGYLFFFLVYILTGTH